MKKNKGFTMVELLAVIILIGVLSAVAVTSMSKLTEKAKQSSYDDFEKTLEEAATNYFITYAEEIPSMGNQVTISAQTLIQKGLLETMNDPADDSKNCDQNSYVVVRQEASPNGYNMNLIYEPCLVCSHYQSNSCK